MMINECYFNLCLQVQEFHKVQSLVELAGRGLKGRVFKRFCCSFGFWRSFKRFEAFKGTIAHDFWPAYIGLDLK